MLHCPRSQVVKRRLEKERDLEGIDMGNVISGARRSRTANAAPVNYRCDCWSSSTCNLMRGQRRRCVCFLRVAGC
jgi:hypothetical protein